MQSNVSYENSAILMNFLRILFKRKRIILTFFFSVVTVVTAASFLMPKVYRASSKILVEIEPKSEKAILFNMNPQMPFEKYDWIKAELEIIQSYPVAARVVEELGLDRLIDDDNPTMTEADGEKHFKEVVDRIQEKLKVEVVGNSNVLKVSFDETDPKLAANIVNRFITTFIGYRSEISNQSQTHQFFEEQLKIATEKLRELEKRQSDYKQKKRFLSTDAHKELLRTKLADYEKKLTETRTARIIKESKLSVIKKELSKGQYFNIPSIDASDSPSREKHIAKLRGEILDLEIQREKLLQKFKPQFKEVLDLDKIISATLARIESEIQQIIDVEDVSVRALHVLENEFLTSIEKIKEEIKVFAQNEFEFVQLSRGIDENREVHSMLMKELEEARISLAKPEKDVRIRLISPAIIPISHVFPKKALNMLIAMFIGLLGGLALAYAIEFFDNSIESPADLERYAGIPALGSVREINHMKMTQKDFQGIT